MTLTGQIRDWRTRLSFDILDNSVIMVSSAQVGVEVETYEDASKASLYVTKLPSPVVYFNVGTVNTCASSQADGSSLQLTEAMAVLVSTEDTLSSNPCTRSHSLQPSAMNRMSDCLEDTKTLNSVLRSLMHVVGAQRTASERRAKRRMVMR